MTRLLALFTAVTAGVAWLALCGPAHADLINYWAFDETGGPTAYDSGSNPLHLALQGDAQFVNDATRGQVLALDGNGDYANNSGEPFASDGTYTIGLWVNHSTLSSPQQRWISWGKAGARFFIGPYNGSITAGFGSSGTTFNVTPVEDTWEYWTFVRQGTSATLYRNGSLAKTVVAGYGGAIDTSIELRIGRQYDANNEYVYGMMDDMAIWNEALTVAQINNAMGFGADRYLVPEPSSAALLFTAALGLLGMLGLRRSRPLCSHSCKSRTTA